MDLSFIYSQLKVNLQYFKIQDSDLNPRYRILVDETVAHLDCHADDLDEESFINIRALRSRAWDLIHTGKWSDVAVADKYLYSLSTYLEVLAELKEFLINNSDEIVSRCQIIIERCIESMDMGILLGLPVPDDTGLNVFCSGASLLSRFVHQIAHPVEFTSEIIKYPFLKIDSPNMPIGIPIKDLSSVKSTFVEDFYSKGLPLLINNNFSNWPGMEKWKDIAYFQRNFGFRTVPIEIGSQYTQYDWGQELMLFKDFLDNQFKEKHSGPIQYLAQHDLFQQIPELKEDIGYPELLTELGICPKDVDVKIWFGPADTVSPLHYDKKENFLCQVIGWKRIILISPEDSAFVYPFEGEMMCNTSQLDLMADSIDQEKFPEAEKAKRLHVILGPGQTLFIPFGWWHHVTSLSPSISVSFWWNKVE